MSVRIGRRILSLVATSVLALSAATAAAQASLPPVKLVETDHFPVGFEFGHGVAVNNDASSAEHGDVYVVDIPNHRVQVFTPTGTFVEMFGREVNKSTAGNVCDAVEEAAEQCQAGLEGSAAGQFSTPVGIASDPSSGDFYVEEFVEGAQRVQAFTAEGQFLFEIGREVNTTAAQKNVCAQAEIASCVAPKPSEGSTEEGVFNFTSEPYILAAGGPNDLLFVGDENRVQEFHATTGVPAEQQISLTSIGTGQVQALTLDQTSGDVYLLYPEQASGTIHEFSEAGSELASFTIKPRSLGQELFIHAIVLDPTGRLAVQENESGSSRGSLYEPSSGKRITGFAAHPSFGAMAFDDEGDLYIAETSSSGAEVFAYTTKPIAELTLGAGNCGPGPVVGSSALVDCTLHGEINTEGVAEAEAFFEYGRTSALGEMTPLQPVASTGPVQATVSLRPNETYDFRLAGYDANVKPPEEAFTTEQGSLATETVSPIIVGEPSTLGVRAASATLFSELNPENAHSEYFFEYGSPEALAKCTRGLRLEGSCPGILSTPVTVSSVYGQIGAKAEISGLQPGTTYGYRLFAEDENRTNASERFQALGPEAQLITSPPPNPFAQTGGVEALTATSAVISGSVNPDGQPAGYVFELGVYNGAATQYTIVQSGSAGGGTEPVAESFEAASLQPGTTYAYRIAVTSAYVKNEAHTLYGAAAAFTTAGIPAVLASPVAMQFLAVPNILFLEPEPSPPPSKCKHGFVRNKHSVCVRLKHRKHGKRAGRKSRRGRRR